MMRALALWLCVLPLMWACGPNSATSRFEVQGQGSEVLDKVTGLTWRLCPQGMGSVWPAKPEQACLGEAEAYTWEAAQARATAFAAQSGKPWRLPTVHELNSLTIDTGHGHAWAKEPFPAHLMVVHSGPINPDVWPNFWSVNAYDSDMSKNAMWFVAMDIGKLSNWKPSQKMYVRLVR